jgi:hypothetical protein
MFGMRCSATSGFVITFIKKYGVVTVNMIEIIWFYYCSAQAKCPPAERAGKHLARGNIPTPKTFR